MTCNVFCVMLNLTQPTAQVSEYHCCLTGTKLYSLVTEAHRYK